MNTARNVVNVEPESQGHGLVQVQAACEAIANTDPVHYTINCGSGSRGIYIRHPSGTRVLIFFSLKNGQNNWKISIHI